MAIYIYRCPECFAEEEIILPVGSDYSKIHCKSFMQRVITLPQPAIMKPTGNSMALDSLNSKGTSHIKPKYKEMARRGLERPPKTIF